MITMNSTNWQESMGGGISSINPINSTNSIQTAKNLLVNGYISATGAINTFSNLNVTGNIQATGSVGIGGIIPNYTLDVNGTTRLNTTRGVLIGTSTDLDGARLISALDNSLIAPGIKYVTFGKTNTQYNQAELSYYHDGDGSAANRLGLGLHSIAVLHVLGSGRVGIGKTNPSTALDVNGGITKSVYNSGEVIQSKCLSSAIGTGFTTSISGNYPTAITSLGFTPKSSNSYIVVSMDCTYSIPGSGPDTWQSGITIAGTTVITKVQTWLPNGSDISILGRGNNNNLFPLMGIAPNTSTSEIIIQILAGKQNSDDTLTLSNINVEIKEIQQ